MVAKKILDTGCSILDAEFVIPAKSRKAGREPGSRTNLILSKFTRFPFDFAQGGESIDVAQDREPVERPVEPRSPLAVGGLVRNDGFEEL
jgi:hypothetical protein